MPFCVHTLCDGDPALLRTLPRAEVEGAAWIAALGGGAFFLSDDLRDLESERTTWLTRDMAEQGLSGMPAVPISSQMTLVPIQLNSQLLEQSDGKPLIECPYVGYFMMASNCSSTSPMRR